MMNQIKLVIGQAGTGKTTWLMQEASKLCPNLINNDHQKLLALTRMHGARRRLNSVLKKYCPDVSKQIFTIDSFALSILNRFRRHIGNEKPVIPNSKLTSVHDTFWGIEASFQYIMQNAASLLKSVTLQKIYAASFPLIIVDEFQDCHSSQLDFIKALSAITTVLLAADDFQLLDDSIDGCPSVEWVRLQVKLGKAEIIELVEVHRTNSEKILTAASCLRINEKAHATTVPVICCPGYGLIAAKIFYKLLSSRLRGTSIIICPTKTPLLEKVLGSMENQAIRRGKRPFNWNREISEKMEVELILDDMNVRKVGTDEWIKVPSYKYSASYQIADNVQRVAKLKGINKIPNEFVQREIERITHDNRAFLTGTGKRTITTIHGAKNREFDNVFILWPYNVPTDFELQRRWLYNAITRSKKMCVILVEGNLDRALKDSVLQLLGPPEDGSPPRKKGNKYG